MTDEEFNRNVKEVVEQDRDKGRSLELAIRAFDLNNERFAKETKPNCGGCVERVWRRMQNYYLQHNLINL